MMHKGTEVKSEGESMKTSRNGGRDEMRQKVGRNRRKCL